MGVEWRNNGEPVDGEYIADVDVEDGSQVQTYKGASYREVADKLLAAQLHGSRRINELKKEIPPDPKPQTKEFKPRQLSADERYKLTGDLQDPDKMPEALEAILEARLGGPVDEVTGRLNEIDHVAVQEAAVAATVAFVEATPDWFATDENKKTLWDYMELNDMAHTTKNFGIAFDRLMEDGLLTRRPETTNSNTEDKAKERIVPQQTTRQRGSFGSTGVRSSDVGHTVPPKPKPKYTRQDIQEMPRHVYAHKMTNEAGFAALVNGMKF